MKSSAMLDIDSMLWDAVLEVADAWLAWVDLEVLAGSDGRDGLTGWCCIIRWWERYPANKFRVCSSDLISPLLAGTSSIESV